MIQKNDKNGKTDTMADKIRAMTDEELAEYAYKDLGNYCCPPGREHATKTCNAMEGDCGYCWLEWIQSDAED